MTANLFIKFDKQSPRKGLNDKRQSFRNSINYVKVDRQKAEVIHKEAGTDFGKTLGRIKTTDSVLPSFMEVRLKILSIIGDSF